MKWKTPNGKIRDIKGIHTYLVDWTASQGSEFSTEVLELLEPYWRHDMVFAELPVAGTRLRYDFVNLSKRIICETDGIQHSCFSEHFHSGSREKYKLQIKNDLLKDRAAETNGFQMVRIKPADLPKLRVSPKAWFKAYHDITL